MNNRKIFIFNRFLIKSRADMFKHIISFSFIIFTLSFLFFNFADAQTAQPQFLVSWQAKTYAPSWYQGKSFPTKDASVGMSFELIDKGKIADLSKEKIRWYVNDRLEKNEENGLGIKSINFSMRDYPGQTTEVRVEIFHYKNGDVLGKIVEIPSVRPELITDSPYADNQIGVGQSIFRAFPLFFDIKSLDNLSTEWSAMGRQSEGSGNPWQLNLNIDQKAPKGMEVNLSVSVKNILKELEFASKSMKLVIK